MKVRFHPQAEDEHSDLPVVERIAISNVVEKLEALGVRLPFPHQSAVKGVRNLRELRPRGGDSPWRAFYRRMGNDFVVAAIGPDAKVDRGEFQRAVIRAIDRLDEIKA